MLGLLRSDRDQLAVLAEGHPQGVADLTQGGPRLDRVDDLWHEVAVAARGLAQPLQRRFPGDRVALRAHASQSRDLVTLPVRVDALQLRRVELIVNELVDSDNDLLPRLDASLRVI